MSSSGGDAVECDRETGIVSIFKVSNGNRTTGFPPMATQVEVSGAAITLQFVVAMAVVFLLVPLEAAPLVPIFLILAVALYHYLT